jgi:hypothetical protein
MIDDYLRMNHSHTRTFVSNSISLPLLQPFPPSRELIAEEFGGAGAEEVVGDFVFGGHLILFSIQPLPGGHDADREALLL